MSKIRFLTDYDISELRRLKQKLDGAQGMLHAENSMAVDFPPPPRQKPTTTPRQTITFKITGSRPGGGFYSARSLSPATVSISSSVDATESDLFTIPDEANAIGFNLQEINKSTHDLMDVANVDQLYFIGRLWGTCDDGAPLILFNGIWVENCL